MTLEFWDRIINKICNNERKKGTGEYKDILLVIVVDILWEKGTNATQRCCCLLYFVVKHTYRIERKILFGFAILEAHNLSYTKGNYNIHQMRLMNLSRFLIYMKRNWFVLVWRVVASGYFLEDLFYVNNHFAFQISTSFVTRKRIIF